MGLEFLQGLCLQWGHQAWSSAECRAGWGVVSRMWSLPSKPPSSILRVDTTSWGGECPVSTRQRAPAIRETGGELGMGGPGRCFPLSDTADSKLAHHTHASETGLF